MSAGELEARERPDGKCRGEVDGNCIYYEGIITYPLHVITCTKVITNIVIVKYHCNIINITKIILFI